MFTPIEGAEAVRHLFRVAASLDSMVVGEPQILGQLKQYYDAAQQAGTVGAILHRLFHRSFSVAKRVRSETGIGSGAVSVSSMAVDLAKRIFDRFDDKTVMLIGAGKIGDLMARHLQSHGVKSLMVTNRTFERAVALAEKIHGNPIRFEDFPALSQDGRSRHRLRRRAGSTDRRGDGGKSSARAETEGDVFHRYRRPAQLRREDQRSRQRLSLQHRRSQERRRGKSSGTRQRSARRPKSIVLEEVQSFVRWLGSLEQVPTITALRQRFEEIRRREIEKSLGGGLKDLSAEQRAAVQDMTTAMINKMLHGPISQFERARPRTLEDPTLYVAALKKLFDLEGK